MWGPIAPLVLDKMTDIGFPGQETPTNSFVFDRDGTLEHAPHLGFFEIVGSGCNVNEHS